MQMKVYPHGQKAELAIGTYETILPNFGLYLQDIQQFTQTAFPNRTLRLNAEPSDSLVEKPPVFDINLKDVTEELMRPLADLQKRRQMIGSDIVEGHCLQYHAYDVLLENQKLPLFSLGVGVNWPDYPNTGRIFFPVKNFYFEGPSAEVERLLPLKGSQLPDGAYNFISLSTRLDRVALKALRPMVPQNLLRGLRDLIQSLHAKPESFQRRRAANQVGIPRDGLHHFPATVRPIAEIEDYLTHIVYLLYHLRLGVVKYPLIGVGPTIE